MELLRWRNTFSSHSRGSGRECARIRSASGLIDHFGAVFPAGTLLVNVTGSLILAGCAGRWAAGPFPELRLLLAVGLSGLLHNVFILTVESLALTQEGGLWAAFVNVAGNNLLGLRESRRHFYLGRLIGFQRRVNVPNEEKCAPGCDLLERKTPDMAGHIRGESWRCCAARGVRRYGDARAGGFIRVSYPHGCYRGAVGGLPLKIEWADTPAQVQRLLPALRRMTGTGVITVQEVTMAYRLSGQFMKVTSWSGLWPRSCGAMSSR